MGRERKRKCTVVKCNKKRMWINTLLLCICAVAVLACASKQPNDEKGVASQETEAIANASTANTSTENVSSEEKETTGDTTQESVTEKAENAETTATESDEKQTVIKEMGELDVEDRMLLINGKLYHATQEIGPMGDSGCVGGTIESTVAIGETPQNEKESNFDCVGNPYTFDSGDGAIQVLLEDDNYYWFYTDKKIEWKEATSLVITKGDTGEQQTLKAGDESYIKIMDTLQSLHLRDVMEEERLGYAFCIRTYDDAQTVMQTITLYGDMVDFDGDKYADAAHGEVMELYLMADALYPSVAQATVSEEVAEAIEVNKKERAKLTVSYATANGANLLFTNNTGKQIMFSEEYTLQAKDGEDWKEVQVIEPKNYTAIAFNLEDGIRNWGVLWKYNHGSLPDGTYRIVKEISCGEGREKYQLVAEFTLPWAE